MHVLSDPNLRDSGDSEVEYKTVEIKKNQFDATAVIIYSNGGSIIHWAMAFGTIFVRWPDVEKARAMERPFLE